MSSNRRKMLEATAKRKKLKKDFSITNKRYNDVQRQCLNKNTYSTLKTAQRVIDSIKDERGTTMRVYQCNICEFYHITHNKFVW